MRKQIQGKDDEEFHTYKKNSRRFWGTNQSDEITKLVRHRSYYMNCDLGEADVNLPWYPGEAVNFIHNITIIQEK